MSRTVHRKPFTHEHMRHSDETIWEHQGCSRKRPFETERVARAFIAENADLMLDCYECLYCKRWHLSSEPKRIVERLERHLRERGVKC